MKYNGFYIECESWPEGMHKITASQFNDALCRFYQNEIIEPRHYRKIMDVAMVNTAHVAYDWKRERWDILEMSLTGKR